MTSALVETPAPNPMSEQDDYRKNAEVNCAVLGVQRVQGMRIWQRPRCISPQPVDQGSLESRLEIVD